MLIYAIALLIALNVIVNYIFCFHVQFQVEVTRLTAANNELISKLRDLSSSVDDLKSDIKKRQVILLLVVLKN